MLNGMVYVGRHSTSNMDDGYMGSGKALREAYAELGVQAFRKHVLRLCESKEELCWFEREVVNEEFIKDDNTYNLVVGGDGADWSFINSNEPLRREKNKRAALAMNRVLWSNADFRDRKVKEAGALMKRLHKEGRVKPPNWVGKHHKIATKQAIGRANALLQRGEGNSQFGTVWINDPEQKVSRKVKKEELQVFLEQGWHRGRKMKW